MEFPNPFQMPVASLAREVAFLDKFDTLGRAAQALHDFGGSIAFVIESGKYIGAITESGLMKAQEAGASWLSTIEPFIERDLPRIQAEELGAGALRLLGRFGETRLVVLDANGCPIGVLQPSDLFPRPLSEPRPPMVGGMATPFGVYLTNGKLRAGAKDFALVCTGSLLFLLFFGASVASEFVGTFAFRQFGHSQLMASIIQDVLPLTLFLLGMRLLPLAGIHAAEHKVVHAIERGEPLVSEVVNRMPRIHPRCGTNLAAAAALFLGLMNSTWIRDPELRLLLAALITLVLWRPLGSLMQQWVTTRPPSAKQIQMGIDSATELLEKYRIDRERSTNPIARIWASGMIHVMAGSFLMYLLIAGVAMAFQIDVIL